MTTAFRNWLLGTTTAGPSDPTKSALSAPTIIETSPQASDDEDGDDTEREDDDRAPAFPSLNSAQRLGGGGGGSSGGSAPIPSILSTAAADRGAALMPPPPNPSLARRTLGAAAPRAQAQAQAGSLMLPPSTTKAPVPKAKKREKVALAPGFGPLDWAALKTSGEDLRGIGHPGLLRVTLSELKEHRTRDDAWSVFNGKVYNITAYLPYHPGGEKEMMRVAGRDGTKLFMSTHAWVNADYMLDGCMIGFLVPEPSS